MSPGPDRGYYCDACKDEGLVLLRDGDDTLGYGACPNDDCERGRRLRTILTAIANGEPVVLEHALDHPQAYGPSRPGFSTPLAHRITPTKES